MKQTQLLLTRRQALILLATEIADPVLPLRASDFSGIPAQPYFASVGRAIESLAKLGTPIVEGDALQLSALSKQGNSASIGSAETILSQYTLINVAVPLDGPLRVTLGGAPRTLIEQGWRVFLVRIANISTCSDDLSVRVGTERTWGTPGNMMPGASGLAQRAFLMDTVEKAPLIESTWLLARLFETVTDRYGKGFEVMPLSGSPIEYGVLQLFSRDPGQRSANISFCTTRKSDGSLRGTGHRQINFDSLPSRIIALTVRDSDGRGCVASLTFKDKLGRIYPPQAMRLAPDMSFQPQIYRGDGETVRLPDGEYSIESKRGPEYLSNIQVVIIDGNHDRVEVKLTRWIDPAAWGWYSGDTHIHAGGCAHYQVPTEGVSPQTMIRHTRGEGLSIGDILTWGPSWYYQKQFFTGRAESPQATLEHPDLQKANNANWHPTTTPEDAESILRYDVEVSGFPSSHAGHLVLLRLRDQDYPGTKLIEEWPSWNLPILKWAREQGALTGYAHCGSGMTVDSTELPNYEIPPMDGVGTQEAIVDVTHDAVDFLAGCDTGPIAELNAWYHMLNCGFRLAMVGETDFPCITGERVGMGRTYVRLDRRPKGDQGYEAWVRNLRRGPLYCGDGRSHFLEFRVNGRAGGDADVELTARGNITIEALVVARLELQARQEAIDLIHEGRAQPGRWGWHLEQARIGNTREVAVELVLNGVAVERSILLADGSPRAIKMQTTVSRSSWVALRILPSAHTSPIFIRISNKPVRASKRSAQWCRSCVDKLWEVKAPFIRENERAAAEKAFDHARDTYNAIMADCDES